MDKISRKINNKKIEFQIYTASEADDRGIAYKPWKEVDVGDMGISDDGYVGICLSRKEYKKKIGNSKAKVFIRLSHGVGWVTKTSKLLYEPNRAMNRYTAINPRIWVDGELRRTRTKNLINAYVEMLLSDKGIDWEQLGKIYRPDQQIPAATVRRLMKREEIQTVVEAKVRDILNEKGITKEYVVDLHQEALDMAKKKCDVGNFLRATENFMDLLEMKPGKRVVTDTIEMNVTSSIADTIAKEEKQLIVEKKSEERVKPEV